MGLGVGGYCHPFVTVESIFLYLPPPPPQDFTCVFDRLIESPSEHNGRGHARCFSSFS